MENYYCAVCGAQNLIENIYCTKCGKSVDSSATTSQSQPTGSAVFAHLGPMLIGFVAFYVTFAEGQSFFEYFAWMVPLLILKSKGSDTFTKNHARESLNFLLFWLIFDLTILLIEIFASDNVQYGFLFLFFVLDFVNIYQFVVVILAIIAAATRKPFIYPLLPIRFIKS